jgi:cyanophycin synthetase
MNPAFRLSKSWHYYRGYVFGMQQRCLVGTLGIARASMQQVQRLERLLQQLSPQAQPPRLDADHARLALAQLLVFWSGELQRLYRIPISSKVYAEEIQRDGEEWTVFRIALPVLNGDGALEVLAWLANVGANLVSDSGVDEAYLGDKKRQLSQILEKYRLSGINRFFIADACFELDFPVSHFFGSKAVQIGTGCYSRNLSSLISDQTPALGVDTARNKALTAEALHRAGLAGAVHQLVDSVEEASKAAARLGYPVAVKPVDSEQGAGITGDIPDDRMLAAAVSKAKEYSRQVLVEKWQAGFTHRLTVFNGKLIRVVRRVAWGVTGDGVSSIEQLVRRRASSDENTGYFPQTATDVATVEYLGRTGRTIKHVPAAGEYVRLRATDNINTGGSNQLIALDGVHPDNLLLATDAAAVLGLDFAGVDLITPDIGQSWLTHPATICEINAEPQLGNRSDPGIYRRILREFMANPVRIEVHLHLCPEASQAQLVDRLKALDSPHCVAGKAGIWIDGVPRSRAFDHGHAACMAALRRRDVMHASLVITLEELLQFGLPADYAEEATLHVKEHCDPGVIEMLRGQPELIRPHLAPAAFEKIWEALA